MVLIMILEVSMFITCVLNIDWLSLDYAKTLEKNIDQNIDKLLVLKGNDIMIYYCLV